MTPDILHLPPEKTFDITKQQPFPQFNNMYDAVYRTPPIVILFPWYFKTVDYL